VNKGIRSIGLAATASLVVLMLASALPHARADGSAGSTITNTARGDYTYAGRNATVTSNSVTATVAHVSQVSINPGQASGSVPPSGTTYLAHQVTNMGNGPDSFDLAGTTPTSWTVRFLRDDNGDSKRDATENTQITSTGALQPGASAYLLAEVTAPSSAAAGTDAPVTISAQSASDSSVRAVANDKITVGNPGKVTGRVKSREGVAVAGVKVTAKRSGTQAALAATASGASYAMSAATASDGSYSINSLPLGTYDIVVSGADIVPQQASGKSLTAAQPIASVDFNVPRAPVLQSGTNLVSIPFTFASSALPAVVGLTSGARVAAWRPDPSGGRYVYLGRDADFPPVEPGRAFVISQSSVSTLAVLQAPAGTGTATVALKPGWNLIGWPDLSWASLSSLGVRAGGQRFAFAEAARRGIVQGYAWGYDPRAGDYMLVHPAFPGAQRALEAWKGYWVRAYADCELLLSTPATAPAPRPDDQSGVNWAAQLAATCGRISDRFNYLGVASDASSGTANPYRLESPPTASEQSLDLSFTPASATSTQNRYATDFRSPSSGKIVWDFSVKTNAPNATVVLSWPDIRRVPPNYNLNLVDLEAGRRRYMRTSTSYSYTTGPTGGERKFQVVADPAPFARLSISPLAQMPAPSGVTLSYTLSLDSSVSVEVRTLSGMMVRRVASGRPGTMGTNLVTWDGNDQNGRRAANGPYLVVITALNGDGQMVKQSRTVTLVR